jgi:hypothetical protein
MRKLLALTASAVVKLPDWSSAARQGQTIILER